jgi:hypothetical protein
VAANDLSIAVSRFEAFRANPPSDVSETEVAEYHAIVDALANATGESALGQFKISESELEKRVVSVQRGGYNGSPGRTNYSKKRYCDAGRFQRQVEGLSHFLTTCCYLAPQGANRHDRAARPPSHTVNIGQMYGSAIQQGTQGSQIKVTFDAKGADFKEFIAELKAAVPKLPLSHDQQNQIFADIGTIEVQILAPTPKRSVIAECGASIRNVIEGIAANLIASPLLPLLYRYFPK